MCRVKNIVKRGVLPRTAHIPGHEAKKPIREYVGTKRFSQILRKTKNIRDTLTEYHTRRNTAQKDIS